MSREKGKSACVKKEEPEPPCLARRANDGRRVERISDTSSVRSVRRKWGGFGFCGKEKLLYRSAGQLRRNGKESSKLRKSLAEKRGLSRGRKIAYVQAHKKNLDIAVGDPSRKRLSRGGRLHETRKTAGGHKKRTRTAIPSVKSERRRERRSARHPVKKKDRGRPEAGRELAHPCKGRGMWKTTGIKKKKKKARAKPMVRWLHLHNGGEGRRQKRPLIGAELFPVG